VENRINDILDVLAAAAKEHDFAVEELKTIETVKAGAGSGPSSGPKSSWEPMKASRFPGFGRAGRRTADPLSPGICQ
jgi:hypothetical protein